MSISKLNQNKNSDVSVSDVSNLYDEFLYFGRMMTESAVVNMFIRDETPLPNYWKIPEDFFHGYEILHKIALHSNSEQFAHMLQHPGVPIHLELNRAERLYMMDYETMHEDAIHFHQFFDKMDDYLEYEIKLIALGYPCVA